VNLSPTTISFPIFFPGLGRKKPSEKKGPVRFLPAFSKREGDSERGGKRKILSLPLYEKETEEKKKNILRRNRSGVGLVSQRGEKWGKGKEEKGLEKKKEEALCFK